MPVMRGRVALILGFVVLTTFLAAVRGLPVRKQRSNSPKERSSKLEEVKQPLGKDGEPGGCWDEPFSASAPSPVPGKAEEGRDHLGAQRGSLGGGCEHPEGAASDTCPRGQAARSPGGEAGCRASPLLGCFRTR